MVEVMYGPFSPSGGSICRRSMAGYSAITCGCATDTGSSRRSARLSDHPHPPMCQMTIRIACLLLCAVTAWPYAASGQTLTWRELPAAPFTGRHNDAFFATAESGWIVNGDGEIYRTDDGGASWQLQFRKTTVHFRSVGFVNEERGFAGNVGDGEFGTTDRSALYETRDGGLTWSPMGVWNGPAPTGLCGMQVVNDTVVVAVGRVRGPATFARTTDGGATWRSKDMGSYAAGLIDVYFAHPDTGYAVGLTNEDHELSSGIILYTEDGGETWVEQFRSTRTGEWCWKISFPSPEVGYVSLQRNSRTPIYILKTSDGGVSWEEKLFSDSYYFVQGIGFIDEDRGWIGGNSTSPVYQTEDGGETWWAESIRPRLNRFRFLGDTLGYAVGRSVHKLADWSAVAVDPVPDVIDVPSVDNFPNPFADRTRIRYTVGRPSIVTVEVFDILGRTVVRLVDDYRLPGEHVVEWDGLDVSGKRVAAGTYLYVVTDAVGSVVRSMQLVR